MSRHKYEEDDIVVCILHGTNKTRKGIIIGKTTLPSGSLVYTIQQKHNKYIIYEEDIIKQVHKNKFNKQKQELNL